MRRRKRDTGVLHADTAGVGELFSFDNGIYHPGGGHVRAGMELRGADGKAGDHTHANAFNGDVLCDRLFLADSVARAVFPGLRDEKLDAGRKNVVAAKTAPCGRGSEAAGRNAHHLSRDRRERFLQR